MRWQRSAVIAVVVGAATAAVVRATPDAQVEAAAPGGDDAAASLIARVDRVAKQVAKLRGLARRKPIAREVVAVDELRKRLAARAGADQAAADLAAEAFALERWGVLPPGTDYGGMLVDVLTEQIAGYYDHDQRKLFIASREPAAGPDAEAEAWGEMLLAHEIDHALCDQHFDLAKLLATAGGDGDAIAARRALVEGDGMALMIEYLLASKGRAAPWTDPDITQMLEHTMEANGPVGARLGAAPLWIREGMIFPYRAGLAYVGSIRRRHPWSSVDAAYRRPPRSTEQVLHPELYASDDRPIAVTAATPPALSDLRQTWTDVWGEEKWGTFLRAHGVDDQAALAAAAGWGGDRVAVYARDGDADPAHAIAIARTVWDSDVDAQEASEALVRALDQFTGAAAERGDDGGRWLGAGRVSWVERKGQEIVVVIGAPAPVADALRAQVWTAWKVKAPRR